MLERSTYDAFGPVTFLDAWFDLRSGNANAREWNFLFRDDVIKLYNYGYRFYHETLGRWLSSDPIGEWDPTNYYAFARNLVATSLYVYGLFLQKMPSKDLRLGIVGPVEGLGTCGNAIWQIRWQVTGALRSGVIAQKIDMECWSKACGKRAQLIAATMPRKEAKKALAKTPVEDAEYTEYWPVSANGAVTANLDQFAFSRSPKIGICTMGELTIEAVAAFFEGVDLPPNAKPGAVRQAGGLPAHTGRSFPSGAARKSNKFSRTFKIAWDCCDGQRHSTTAV